MNTTVTKDGYIMATQVNSTQTPGFAYFSDTIRDALKGSVFDTSTGYISGASGKERTIEQCFRGLTDWCTTPAQTINYASCHDNLTLMDRLTRSVRGTTREEQIRMNNLAAAIYLTAEGIPFMQAGEEMLRSKPTASGTFDENSYSSPDSVNSLKWETLEKEEYWNVYQYYKGLIAFRKAHGALRLGSAQDVEQNVSVVEGLPENVTAFRINGGVNGETAEELFVIFNPNKETVEVTLPEGVWNVCINGEKAGTEALETITNGVASVTSISAMVLIKGEGIATAAPQNADQENASVQESEGNSGIRLFMWMAIVCVGVAVIAGIVLILAVRRKRGKK